MDLEYWVNHKAMLERQIDALASGRLVTKQLRPTEIDTTDESLRMARQSLEAVERLLARHTDK